MTAEEIANLVVRLTGDASAFQRMLAQAQQQVNQFAATVTQTLATAGEMIGFKGAMSAFTDYQDNLIRLETAITANGQSVDSTMAKYKEFADQIEATTRVSAIDATQLLATAASFDLVGEKAEKVARIAIGISQMRGIAPQGIIQSLSMFMDAMEKGGKGGGGRGVYRLAYLLGIAPTMRGEGGKGAEEAHAELMEKINKRLKIAEEVATKFGESFGGQLARVKNYLKDIIVQLGEVTSKWLEPFVKKLGEVVKAFKEMDMSSKKMATSLFGIAAVLTGSGPIGYFFTRILPLALRLFSMTNVVIAGLVIAVGYLAKNFLSMDKVVGVWTSIVSAAKLAWGYIKAYFNAFVEWARPYWNIFKSWLANTWDSIKSTAMKVWEGVKTKTTDFLDWAWPILLAWFGFVKAGWGLLAAGAAWAWNKIRAVAGPVMKWLVDTFNSILSKINIDWQKVQLAGVTFFIAMEYYLRNLDKVWTIIWTGMLYHAVKVINEVKFFFTNTLPTIFNWLLNITIGILKASLGIWTAYFKAIGNAAQLFADNFIKIIRGMNKAEWGELFKELGKRLSDDFAKAVKNVPLEGLKLPERVPDALENQLKGAFDKEKRAFDKGFDEFFNDRISKYNQRFPGFKLLPPDLQAQLKEADVTSQEAAKTLSAPFEKATKEIHKWEAALYGSAEHYSRWQEYMDRLNEWKAPVGVAGEGKPVGGKEPPTATNIGNNPWVSRWGDEAAKSAASSNRMEVALDNILNRLKEELSVKVTNLKKGGP